MRTGPKTSGSPRGYRRRRHRPREVWSSPQRWTDGLGGRRDGRWPSRTPRTGSRWWLWYRPMCPPDPESEGFRRPSDREDIDYRVRGQLGLSMALIALSLLLDFLTPNVGLPTGLRPDPSLAVLTGILSLAYPTVGALIVSRLPANPIGWIFCSVGLLSAVRPFTVAYADYALLKNPALPGEEYVAWFSSWEWFALPTLAVFLVLLFPDGRPPARRWRNVLIRRAGRVATSYSRMCVEVAIPEIRLYDPAQARTDRRTIFGKHTVRCQRAH